jgi:glucosamine-6-phosphate deaminase
VVVRLCVIEGTGPDTHYKVLQIVADAVRVSLERGDLGGAELLVWGYRNVWFVFTPSDATLFLPGSESDLDLMHDTFMNCFTTQKEASYPSPFYDGPFSGWSRNLQEMQKKDLTVLLGEKYFQEHPDSRVREAAGFVFIKAMPAKRFLREVQGLKAKIES